MNRKRMYLVQARAKQLMAHMAKRHGYQKSLVIERGIIVFAKVS